MPEISKIYRFLRKTGIFLLLIAVMVIVSGSVLNHYLNERAAFKLDKTITSVILGHSQAECAYNDSLITDFKNLAQSGDSYYYAYLKARRVLWNNPQIKRVFIEFSNIDVSKDRDKDLWAGDLMSWKLPIYASLMDRSDYFFLLRKNPAGILKTLPKTFKKQVDRIRSGHYNYLPSTSGYLYLSESKLDSLVKTNHHKTNPNPPFFKESKENLIYLDKLIELFQENKVEVYLIRSPMYQDSYFLANNSLFESVKQTRYKAITLFDFSNFSIENMEFRDLNHLNFKGARKYSEWFSKNVIDSLNQLKD